MPVSWQKMPKTFNYFMKGLISQDDSNKHGHTETYIDFKILQCILMCIYMHAKLNTQQPVVKGIGYFPVPPAVSCLCDDDSVQTNDPCAIEDSLSL